MATIRQHLQKAHDSMAAFHKEMATRHEHLSKCYGSMGKAAGGDDQKMYDDIGDTHDKIAKSHTAQAEFHVEAADECMKASEIEFGKVAPDSVRNVYSTDTFGIRAVPRTGAPDNSAIDKAALARVPIQFRNLISDDGDDQL